MMLSVAEFLSHWQSLPLPGRDGIVLLAVSGGADSMVMAHLFIKAAIPFAIAHCNFRLRSDASDADEELVKSFAAAKNIIFHRADFDTAAISAKDKKGIQETARDLRYAWLKEVATANGYSCICTAHHQDDVAETVIINLARGTGIAGLHGIRPVQDGLVRPLLPFSKADILEYASSNGVVYREDASNRSDDYTRNAIRRHVLPQLELCMPGAAARIAASATRIEEAEIFYRRGIEAERKKLVQLRGRDFYIPLRLLKHRTPLATIIYELLHPFGFSSAQTPEVMSLMTAESGKQVSSATHRALRNRDFIIITTKETIATDVILIELNQKQIRTPEASFEFIEIAVPRTIADDAGICELDADKIEQPVLLRRWKTGDYFYPVGMGGKKKKLSRFFIDRKIPLHEKERIWVLESNRRIAWVCGLRMDERFKITAGTKRVLQIKMATA